MPMSTPNAMNAPFFYRANVTSFLEGFGVIAADRGLEEKGRCVRLMGYCSTDVKDHVKFLPEFIDRDWKRLVKALKKQYRQQDEDQIRLTKA